MSCCKKKSAKTNTPTIPLSEYKHSIEIFTISTKGYNNAEGYQTPVESPVGVFMSYIKTTNSNNDFYQTEGRVGINIGNTVTHRFYVRYTPIIPLNSGSLIIKFKGNKYKVNSVENVNYNYTEIIFTAVIQISSNV
jgi:hypothetical protein